MRNRERAFHLRSSLLIFAMTLAGITSTSLQAANYSAGPAVVAKADQNLWPGKINSVAGFDLASRASIMIYVLALQDMQQLPDTEMLFAFKIKSINRESVEKWLKKEFELSLLNFQRAATNCAGADWTCMNKVMSIPALLQGAAEGINKAPPEFQPWRENLNNFARAYVAEQLRLAALFPKVSSEIDLFNDNEWNGDGFADRQFFLSFDDGPTSVQGSTDATLKMLELEKKSAVFFVLGENFQNRLTKTDTHTLAALYKNQCVASHGWQHQSHAKWDQWQDSVKRTQSLLTSNLASSNVSALFRPPYGQRKDDSGTFFRAQSLQVALWNIDSQDWNNHVDASDITHRVVTLMLIKRHGMLLFHDIHPKAHLALPILFEKLAGAVDWADCQQWSRSNKHS